MEGGPWVCHSDVAGFREGQSAALWNGLLATSAFCPKMLLSVQSSLRLFVAQLSPPGTTFKYYPEVHEMCSDSSLLPQPQSTVSGGVRKATEGAGCSASWWCCWRIFKDSINPVLALSLRSLQNTGIPFVLCSQRFLLVFYFLSC